MKQKQSKSQQAAGTKRLYRSNNERIIAGVCGGMAEYFNVDPVWIRLIAVLLAIVNGLGIIMYIIAWILIPKNPLQKSGVNTDDTIANEAMMRLKEKKNPKIIAGLILILIGGIFLLNKFVPWFNFDIIWPALLVLLGVYIIARGSSKRNRRK